MAKWLILIAGVFLFFNGINSRTYSYANPDNHCFQMDYIRFVGCFGSPVLPLIVTWGATLLGAGLIGWSVFRARRQAPS